MGIEALMAKEAAGLLIRDPKKYLPGVKGLFAAYLISAWDYELSSAGRSAYFFIRNIDDVLDGERKLSNIDPLTYVASLKSQVETVAYTGTPEIIRLAEYSISILEKRARQGDNPKQDILNAMDIMVFDNQRRQGRRALTHEQLSNYYYPYTFSSIANIMLIGLRSQFRATDIPEFSFCQGRVYTVRDLKSDWDTGTINIPKEILNEAGLTPFSSYSEVVESSYMKAWFQNELLVSRDKLVSLQTRLQDLPERLTFRAFNAQIKPMLKFIDRFSQIQPKQPQRD